MHVTIPDTVLTKLMSFDVFLSESKKFVDIYFICIIYNQKLHTAKRKKKKKPWASLLSDM